MTRAAQDPGDLQRATVSNGGVILSLRELTSPPVAPVSISAGDPAHIQDSSELNGERRPPPVRVPICGCRGMSETPLDIPTLFS